jgi:aspartyl-tRNA(Asn)/glutamyl-tRNA(Gln) amidotransferase subunit A
MAHRTAARFVEDVRKGNVNLEDFYSKLFARLRELDKKNGFFAKLAEPPKEFAPPEGKAAGLPVSVKDCICVRGLRSAAGSKILETYVPMFNATCIEKVVEESGVIIGKTNQDEFGFGTFSTNSGFAVPKNPHDAARSCGGSSGGSAGLVAALDMPHVSIAESTGGSISCPASFCGVAGLTPTYGRVSRWGLIDYANSLDKIGTIGRTVEDAAFLYSIIAGHDTKDQTSIALKHHHDLKIDEGVKGMKMGVPKEYFGEGVDKAVEDKVWNAIKKLEEHGASVEELSLPHTDFALSAYYIIASSEASTNLARYCGMRYGMEGEVTGTFNEYFSAIRSKHFGDEAKRRILLGTFARMAGYRAKYYLKAMKVRTLVINDFIKAFSRFDILAAPTMPVVAPMFSEIAELSPLENYKMDVLTVAPNLAGIPMLSVPCGKAHDMPVGIHLMAGHLQEAKILRAGRVVEA